MFDEFFGVPLHPLAVHAPVVLLPIVAVVTLVLLVRTDWRDRFGWWVTGGLAVVVVTLLVARQSGAEAKEAGFVSGPLFERNDHEALGNQTFVIGLVWLALFAGLVYRDRMVRRTETSSLSAAVLARRDPAVLVLSALSAIAAIVATIWLIRTGHAGAESRWSV